MNIDVQQYDVNFISFSPVRNIKVIKHSILLGGKEPASSIKLPTIGNR